MVKRLIIFLSFCPVLAAASPPVLDMRSFHKEISGRPVGERIALWAERFVGTQYDPDPLGEYVRQQVIVADERMDCMYLTFRAVELALADTPEDAVNVALGMRFIGRGEIRDGKVANYEDRFQYGEDMIDSGKWGKEITRELGETIMIEGSRGKEHVRALPARNIHDCLLSFRSGDIIFFVRHPGKRSKDEIIGHIGIIKREKESIFLIHAGGQKNKGGSVKKVLFEEYIDAMPFIGIRVTRFATDDSSATKTRRP
jgi:hypothetical protein